MALTTQPLTAQERSVSRERLRDFGLTPSPRDDPEMATPGLQTVVDMVLAAFYMLGFRDKEWEAQKGIRAYDPDGDDDSPMSLQMLADTDDKWQRLLDDPDHLFNPQDMIDGVYQQFLADVLRQMEQNDCTFRRAVAIAETSPVAEQSSGWLSCSWCAYKRPNVSLAPPPPRSVGTLPPPSVMLQERQQPLFGGGSPKEFLQFRETRQQAPV